MSDPTTELPPISDREGVTDSVRVQILATEHWDLLATRSMIWNQIFSRASMFITLVSAVVVALALVAQATHFDARFRLFALLVLPIVLLLGIATFVHLGEANGEEIGLVASLHRLRQAYMELAPELRPYFPPVPDRADAAFPPSYGANSTTFVRFIGSTPAIVGTINVLVVGTIAALIAEALGAPGSVEVIVGVMAAAAAAFGHGMLVYKRVSSVRKQLHSGSPD